MELHRLLVTYRDKMAPNVHDPLHDVLSRLGDQPQPLYQHSCMPERSNFDGKRKIGQVALPTPAPPTKKQLFKQRTTSTSHLESFTLDENPEPQKKPKAEGIRNDSVASIPSISEGHSQKEMNGSNRLRAVVESTVCAPVFTLFINLGEQGTQTA